MKKGLFIICAIAVVLGITSGALAGATAKQTSRFCVYIDKTDRGNSHLERYGGLQVRAQDMHRWQAGCEGRCRCNGSTGSTGRSGRSGR